MRIKIYKLASKVSLVLRVFMFLDQFVQYIELYTVNTQWEERYVIISFETVDNFV
jgi:hypothetical protein